MVNVGPLEILLVAIIALIVLGPQRLPEVARSVGRGMREFRTALSDAGHDEEEDEDEDEGEPDEGDDEDGEPEPVEDDAPPPPPSEPPGSPAGDAASEDLPEGR